MPALRVFIALAAGFLLQPAAAWATLTNRGLYSPTDSLLVYDSATNLEWLSPAVTDGAAYHSSTVQALINNHGFRYATAEEAEAMINTNFNNPTTASPGTQEAYNEAFRFFELFGVTAAYRCYDNQVGAYAFCFQSIGITASSTSPGTRIAYGMAFDGFSTGRAVMGYTVDENVADPLVGNLLVRLYNEAPVASDVPEPSTWALMALGGGTILASRRRRR